VKFQPGQSGNPKGSTKSKKQKEKQIRELLLKFVPDAVTAIGEMLKDPDHMPFAVKEVLDRVYGKAAQTIDATEDAKTVARAVLQVLAREEEK